MSDPVAVDSSVQWLRAKGAVWIGHGSPTNQHLYAVALFTPNKWHRSGVNAFLAEHFSNE